MRLVVMCVGFWQNGRCGFPLQWADARLHCHDAAFQGDGVGLQRDHARFQQVLVDQRNHNADIHCRNASQQRGDEAPRQGEGWVFLDWKAPIDGGKPAAYKIQRRERPAGDWQDVSTAMDSETTLVDQPRGKELEYRAVAVNKAGNGEPSNTVLAVL
jgi:hypothetical protein